MARIDPHSFFDDAQPRTRSWNLRLRVDFQRKILSGTAELRLAAPSAGPLDLDTKGLRIEKVTALDGGADVPFELGAEEPEAGRGTEETEAQSGAGAIRPPP